MLFYFAPASMRLVEFLEPVDSLQRDSIVIPAYHGWITASYHGFSAILFVRVLKSFEDVKQR